MADYLIRDGREFGIAVAVCEAPILQHHSCIFGSCSGKNAGKEDADCFICPSRQFSHSRRASQAAHLNEWRNSQATFGQIEPDAGRPLRDFGARRQTGRFVPPSAMLLSTPNLVVGPLLRASRKQTLAHPSEATPSAMPWRHWQSARLLPVPRPAIRDRRQIRRRATGQLIDDDGSDPSFGGNERDEFAYHRAELEVVSFEGSGFRRRLSDHQHWIDDILGMAGSRSSKALVVMPVTAVALAVFRWSKAFQKAERSSGPRRSSARSSSGRSAASEARRPSSVARPS
ncbi:hypothetical protein MMMDOFMJ_4147 [Methylobacterium gnaphalii]|nr:hypothetical protein MMMDOFMJ_4147 [Methylobacterium gnaphalii]